MRQPKYVRIRADIKSLFQDKVKCGICGSDIWPFESDHASSGRCAAERASEWAQATGLVLMYIPENGYEDPHGLYEEVALVLDDLHIDYRLTKIEDLIDSRWELWVSQQVKDVIELIVKMKDTGNFQDFTVRKMLESML